MTTMESLLTMLLTDVPRTEFEATLAGVERRREDGNPQGVPTLRELEIVTELRHELERHRTRASGLRGLFETACDLTSLQDIEAVLQAIVRRSRQLLTTDVAYLMLIDTERGDTYMRVTVGTVAPEFTMIRLPMGIGLGGLVAEILATGELALLRRRAHRASDRTRARGSRADRRGAPEP